MASSEMVGRVLCLLPVPEPAPITDRIKRRYPQLDFTYQQYALSEDWKKGQDHPENVTVLFTLSQFPHPLDLAPNLKLVQLFSAGTDHISRLPIYTSSSIPIATCAGVSAPIIAEWVIMNILTASHKYNKLHSWQKQHTWGSQAEFLTVSSTVGKRIGVLGYGAVGRQVTSVVQRMGMDVIAYTASARESEESRRYNGYTIPGTGDPEGKIPSRWFHASADSKGLHEFLSQDLDYLLLSLPLTSSTSNLLGAKEFEILSKRNTFLINISRGEIVDQEALISSLREYEESSHSKGISGAALDVTVPEPLPKDHPLWDAPNCTISPHISGIYKEYGTYAFQVFEENLQRMMEGKKLLNQIDRESGYASATAKI